MADAADRPTFENPPVIEVVCGVQFQKLTGMQAPHFGLLWERYRDDYPRCHSVAPLPATIEGSGQQQPNITFELSGLPPLPRVWFMNQQDTALIQVQQDRLMYNWKQGHQATPYPRYHTVVAKFRDLFDDFVTFAENHGLGDIAVTQLELSYVNHIEQGEAWASMASLGRLFPDFNWRAGERFLPSPEAINWRTSFPLPEEQGRLHVAIQSARLTAEPHTPLVRMDLVARGICNGDPASGMWNWFDLANQWIVGAFIDLTDPTVQEKVWKRAK